MSLPVILLAFGNEPAAPYPGLAEEDNKIYNALSEGLRMQHYLVHRDAYATSESITSALVNFRDQLTCFHYALPAEAASLVLDANGVGSTSFLQLLSSQKQLKLVFLSGNATRNQVKALFEAGVPAVLATFSPVEDRAATRFAEQFYKALAEGKTIREAFEMARAYLQVMQAEDRGIAIFSDGLPPERAAGEFSWGLYIADQAVLDWKLPTKASPEIQDYDYEPNDLLIDLISEKLAQYNKPLDNELDKENIDVPTIKRLVIDAYPLPIGESLRVLFTRSADPATRNEMEEWGLARLRQLVQTYRISIHYLTGLVLAEIRDYTLAIEPERLPAELSETIHSLLVDETPAERSMAAFLFDLLAGMDKLIDRPRFLPEFNDLLRSSAFKDTCLIMEELVRQSGNDSILGTDMKALCTETEKHLGSILNELAFLVKYPLVSVKNIQVKSRKYREPVFRHQIIILDQVLTNAISGSVDEELDLQVFSDSKAVLLLREENQFNHFLNLSPFIIDQRAFDGEPGSKLLFLARVIPYDKLGFELGYEELKGKELRFELRFSEPLSEGSQRPVLVALKQEFQYLWELFFGQQLGQE